jgi:hypothetical protein
MPTSLTADDLAPILHLLEEHRQTLEEHIALLGDHEERIAALESAPEPVVPPEDVPD